MVNKDFERLFGWVSPALVLPARSILIALMGFCLSQQTEQRRDPVADRDDLSREFRQVSGLFLTVTWLLLTRCWACPSAASTPAALSPCLR
jgi:hypothetical protein